MQTEKMLCLGKTVDLRDELEAVGLKFSRNEELAFALAASMIPGLDRFKARRDGNVQDLEVAQKRLKELQEEVAELKKVLAGRRSDLEEVQDDIDGLDRELRELEDRPWSFPFRFLYMLFKGSEFREEQSRLQSSLDESNSRRDELEDEISAKSSRAQGLDDEIDDLQNKTIVGLKGVETELQTIPKMVDALGEAPYPILPVVIKPRREKKKGKNIRVDAQQSMFLEVHRLGDLEKVQVPHVALMDDPDFAAKMEKNVATVKSFKTGVTLITPDESQRDSFGEAGRLVGVEARMKDVVDFLNEVCATSMPQRFDLPVVMERSILGQYVDSFSSGSKTASLESVRVDTATAEKLERFHSQVNEVQNLIVRNAMQGDGVDALFQEIKDTLDVKYKDAHGHRDTAAKICLKSLKQAHVNSLLVRYHFYCPQCNLSPAYLLDEFGIDINTIGEFADPDWSLSSNLQATPATDELINGLSRNRSRSGLNAYKQYIIEHAASDVDVEKVEAAWERSLSSLHDFERAFRRARFNHETSRNDKDPNRREVNQAAFKENMDGARSQYQRLVRSLLSDPYNLSNGQQGGSKDSGGSKQGFSNQIEGPKINTRLIYEPRVVEQDGIKKIEDDGIWQCPQCQSFFPPEQALTGSVDKIRSDIQIPLLNTLWSDSDVWDKVVNLLGDTEKELRDRRINEAQALQSPIDQFLADSRQLRQNFQKDYSKGRAVSERLEMLAKDFESFGLLSGENLKKLIDASETVQQKLDQVDTQLKELQALEQDLQGEPMRVEQNRKLPALSIFEEGDRLMSGEIFAQRLVATAGDTTPLTIPDNSGEEHEESGGES